MMKYHPYFWDGERHDIAPGAVLLRGRAGALAPDLVAAVGQVAAAAPFRRMTTPAGQMSVAMTNCGTLGWVSDRHGYRYDRYDPTTGQPWPAMPAEIAALAAEAALTCGFPGFQPDACLINRYHPGARMGLHQDRDEADFSQPIVSISLGLPAMFLFGGLRRTERPRRIALCHGDIVVWGGTSRLAFHGIAPLGDGVDPLLGGCRINLTLRRAR